MRKQLSAIGAFFDTMGSAIAVSNAVESRRNPRDSDLIRLGIDPLQFRGVLNR